MRKLRFALFGNVFQAKKSSSVQKLLCLLEERQADLQVDATFYRFLTEDLQIAVPASARVITDDDFEADFLISMGGELLMVLCFLIYAKTTYKPDDGFY